MKKLFAKLGYVPQSQIDELRSQLAGEQAVNAELRSQKENLERELRQAISERERHKLAHDSLKEEHEKQQRVQSKLAYALSSRVPITMNGVRQ